MIDDERQASTRRAPQPPSPDGDAGPMPVRRRGLLSGMRVRRKVLFLHTLFSLGLAAILLVPLRPAIRGVIEHAETQTAVSILDAHVHNMLPALSGPGPAQRDPKEPASVRRGSAEMLGIPPALAAQARAAGGRAVPTYLPGVGPGAVAHLGETSGHSEYALAIATLPQARRAVVQLYALTALALLAVYGLVAAALELFILPQHVYEPLGRILDADHAVHAGDTDRELIPESVMPADELGEIMRSRNRTIASLRRHERALADTLEALARTAADLKRKNHLLETARRNLADADRLASLGVMSAGLAHELNTPLAVIKGLAEKLNADPGHRLPADEADLLVRVVHRLERLGESLLDFARVRPPRYQATDLRRIVDEALTLVRLDRDARGIGFEVAVPASLRIECDADRLVQVLVNLLRNAVDSMHTDERREPQARIITGRDGRQTPAGPHAAASPHPEAADPPTVCPARGRVEIAADFFTREGAPWVSLTVADTGPGIDPQVLSRLFEPFVSTRLDARGTGLGLAVAEGIVREHGGILLARNRPQGGAVFEVLLPARPPARPPADGEAGTAPPCDDRPAARENGTTMVAVEPTGPPGSAEPDRRENPGGDSASPTPSQVPGRSAP